MFFYWDWLGGWCDSQRARKSTVEQGPTWEPHGAKGAPLPSQGKQRGIVLPFPENHAFPMNSCNLGMRSSPHEPGPWVPSIKLCRLIMAARVGRHWDHEFLVGGRGGCHYCVSSSLFSLTMMPAQFGWGAVPQHNTVAGTVCGQTASLGGTPIHSPSQSRASLWEFWHPQWRVYG